MQASPNSSIYLPADVRQALDQASQRLGASLERLAEQAIRLYLEEADRAQRREEARRQSLLARREDADADDNWENHADTSGWKA